MQLGTADLSLPIVVSFNSLEGNGSLTNVVATFGDKVLTVNNPAETGKLAIGDQQGIVMTVNIEGTADASQVGSIYTGVKNVATISRSGGVYTVTYSDGQTQTLF